MAERILKAVEFDKCSAKFKKKYADEQALWDAGWLLQPKYDGCFGMAVVRANGDHQMYSRTGEVYTTSCSHILKELAQAADDQSARWEDFVVLGEVWHPDLSFPTISGQFRRRTPSELWFKVNDLLPATLLSSEPYASRLSNLQALLPEIQDAACFVTVVDQLGYLNCTSPRAWAAKLVAHGGFDGAILRDPRAPYTLELAREGQIVKVKPAISLDLRVKRVASGLGNKTGRVVYTLLVEYRGVESFVGSGVPHILDFEVGDIVEVECMSITEDGRLREPRFKGVRHDKKEPDA